IRGFAHGRKIEPAIIIEIERGEAPALFPAEVGEWHAFELLALDVSPQGESRRTAVRKRQIHPAVFVEIKGNDANGGRQIFFRKIDPRERLELTFAWIQQNGGALRPTGNDKINGAIVVEVRHGHARARGIQAHGGFLRNVRKGGIPVVAPEAVRARFAAGSHSQVEIEVAIVVVIHKSGGNTTLFAANPGFFGYVLKLAVAIVMKQAHTTRFADGQIGVVIAIEIARGAAESRADAAQTGLLRHILKFAVAEIVEEAALAFAGADQEKIGFAVAVIVKEARAAAGTESRSSQDALGKGFLRVVNGNFRRGRGHGA